MNRLSTLGLLAIVAGAARIDTAAHATLLDLGDVTRDTTSGLEWLDIPLTVDRSYDGAEQTAFVLDQGFRHATLEETLNLLTNFGMTDFSGTRTAGNALGAASLVALMGPGIDFGNLTGVSGWFDAGPNSAEWCT